MTREDVLAMIKRQAAGATCLLITSDKLRTMFSGSCAFEFN
jgi:hypothetical protein